MKTWKWESLVQHEPQLLDLEREAHRLHYAHKVGGWARVMATLSRLIGPIGDNPSLRTREAYEAARARLATIFLTGEPRQHVATDSWSEDDAAVLQEAG